MDSLSEPTKTISDNQTSAFGGIVVIIVFIGILIGIYYARSGFTKKHLLTFTHEQLVSQKYTVINLTVKEFHNSNKSRSETGKLNFIVKTGQGASYEGTAEVVDETYWLIFHKKKFNIAEIHEK